MAELKTKENDANVAAFLEGVENPVRRVDAIAVRQLMDRITGLPATMWGASIVGYGQYHYRYESGREGDYFRTGFSPRKANLVIYVMPGYTNHGEILARLGKHKIGKSCIYINKLSDVDLGVLEEVIRAGLADMAEKYPQ